MFIFPLWRGSGGCLFLLLHPPAPLKGGGNKESHSNRSLKFLMLNAINTIVIIMRTRVSFHTYRKPVPLIIMFFIIVMKYFGGIMAANQSYPTGIFSIGKMNPDNKIVGSIIPTREMKIACCIVFETVEMRIPSVRLIRIYNILSASKSIRLPLTGKPNTNHERRSIAYCPIIPFFISCSGFYRNSFTADI